MGCDVNDAEIPVLQGFTQIGAEEGLIEHHLGTEQRLDHA